MGVIDKFWRTLIRVTDITPECIFVIIPGWDSELEVMVPLSEIPDNVKLILKDGLRLFAKVNIGVEYIGHIKIKDWES